MTFQTWLADTLRSAGLDVVEEPGWRTRSAEEDQDASTYRPYGLIVHHTGGSVTSTVAGEVRTLIDGRTGLAGPIAQLFLSRAGVWHCVAAGLCHHAKVGWGGLLIGHGNATLLGVEAQHAAGEPWSSAQYQSYVRGVAALCRRAGWDPMRRVAGHKEHQPGDKIDPEFSMPAFRTAVAALVNGDEMTTLDDTFDRGDGGRTSYANGIRDTVWALRRIEPALKEIEAATVDVDALAARLVPHLDAAAERAVRRVLGEVDGATPGVGQ